MSALLVSHALVWLFPLLTNTPIPSHVQLRVPLAHPPVSYAAKPPSFSIVEASVGSEHVEPTPTPTVAVKAVTARQVINSEKPNRSKSSYPEKRGSSNWDALLQQYFGDNWIRARKIMMCESGGNQAAIGPIDSKGYNPIGLFQIKDFAGRPSRVALMDGPTNIAYAASMSRGGSVWTAWQCQ